MFCISCHLIIFYILTTQPDGFHVMAFCRIKRFCPRVDPGPHFGSKLGDQCHSHHPTETSLEMGSFPSNITNSVLSRRSQVQVQVQTKLFLFSQFYKKPKVRKKKLSGLQKPSAQLMTLVGMPEYCSRDGSWRRFPNAEIFIIACLSQSLVRHQVLYLNYLLVIWT